MNIREILQIVVVLACGVAVGYSVGVDAGRADTAATAPPQPTTLAAVAQAPAANSAPIPPAAVAPNPAVVAEEPAGADPGNSEEQWLSPAPEYVPTDAPPIYVAPRNSPHQVQPLGAEPLEPIDAGLDELANVPPDVASRLPNTAFALHGTAFRGDPGKAAVALIVFTDFECAFCGRLVPTLAEIEKQFGEKVVIALRHFPLDFHKDAIHAHRGALAAHEQGKFWQFHDAVFEAQDELNPQAMRGLAARLDLDLNKYDAFLKSEEVNTVMAVDKIVAKGAKVEGTPTMLLNGRKLVGALPMATLRPLIEGEISRVEARAKEKGVPVYQARSEVSQTNFLRSQGEDDGSIERLHQVTTDGVALKGAKDPKVVIMIFSDFECPFCSRLDPIISRAMEEYPDLAVGFRHYPLDIHQQARMAAQSTVFAGNFGKFWEMHDILFKNQNDLTLDGLVRHGTAIGLDGKLLRAALEKGTHAKQVDSDLSLGNLIGVQSTPTVAINGRLLDSVKDYAEYRALIDKAIQQADEIIEAGEVKREGFYENLMKLVPPN
jgi:protein-disulfide isomerase